MDFFLPNGQIDGVLPLITLAAISVLASTNSYRDAGAINEFSFSITLIGLSIASFVAITSIPGNAILSLELLLPSVSFSGTYSG